MHILKETIDLPRRAFLMFMCNTNQDAITLQHDERPGMHADSNHFSPTSIYVYIASEGLFETRTEAMHACSPPIEVACKKVRRGDNRGKATKIRKKTRGS